MGPLIQTWALPASALAVVQLSAMWHKAVSENVPEPYLDEYFHVPQAQRYCRGDYTWDPKITTPPGLYLIAKLFSPIFGCDTASLRPLNVVALGLICPLCYHILRMLRARLPGQTDGNTDKKIRSDNDATMKIDAHAAFNIALFPPLFFFSALFYTDVMSTLVVLLSYSIFLKKTTVSGTVFDNFGAVFVGILALLFRQTNIFWVAVFPAGISVIEALKASASPWEGPIPSTTGGILQYSWSTGVIHDCAVQDGSLRDYILLVLTLIAAALRNPLAVLRTAFPYISLLGFFTGFVVWNGSVVLGDKSAHTATIHLPQMLYIWPYIAFFSAPLLITPLLQPLRHLLPQRLQRIYEQYVPSKPVLKLPSSLWIVLGLTAVHFNTIVHPYTLADNRHYVFYVFRMLLRHPAIKYLAVPVYCVCAWLTLQALGSPSNNASEQMSKRDSRPTSYGPEGSPCQISFILVWLATTTLSLVSAPLVEPRYFIVPWILWRLHVATGPASLPTPKKEANRKAYDVRPSLETAWLFAVNAAITYVFIRRPFEWASEPGKMQRFLW